MEPLSYIKKYSEKKKTPARSQRRVSVNLITNFTDDVLERVFGGMCLSEGFYPSITRAPYKQYLLALKDKKSSIHHSKPDISFIFFDASPYMDSELFNSAHVRDICSELERYCNETTGIVVVNTVPVSYQGPYGNFFSEDRQMRALRACNAALVRLSKRIPTLYVFDTHKVLQQVGELNARDLRGHHAFDMPFSTDFLTALSHEWLAYLRAINGTAKKCVVVDLDNTLWGGVVGEEGPLGVALGPQYPGLAYQNFQRALLRLSRRGILLAINSKNNAADVDEVFQKNPHMILKKEHFAAIRTNWDDKSTNMKSIAKELNIGLESMVFIDDSPLERQQMMQALPEVLVPDFGLQPEEYTQRLFALTVFNQLSLTREDKEKVRMYGKEKKRMEVQKKSRTLDEYIRKLDIRIRIAEGRAVEIARAAQLTQKTNQYNLTTRRYTEGDIVRMLGEKNSIVSTGEVSDTFGAYGIVILSIVKREGAEATLDTFLMSCRVMGRGVERAFFEYLAERLSADGVKILHATFIPTPKNEPVSLFLPEMGFTRLRTNKGIGEQYTLRLDVWKKMQKARKTKSLITRI